MEVWLASDMNTAHILGKKPEKQEDGTEILSVDLCMLVLR